MEKSPAIRSTLARLATDLGRGAFVIADHWEDDHIATAIASPHDTSQLVYFCQAALDDDGLFDYELEIAPSKPAERRYDVAGRGTRVTYAELLEVARAHLGVPHDGDSNNG